MKTALDRVLGWTVDDLFATTAMQGAGRQEQYSIPPLQEEIIKKKYNGSKFLGNSKNKWKDRV